MEFMKESDFRKEIKANPGPGYLFFGEEDYMKAFALTTAAARLSPDPTLAFFNEIKFDSFTYSPEALLNALMPLPMMADRKLITISGLDFNTMKQNEVEALCTTLGALSEYDYNTVILHTASDRFDPGILPKRPSPLLQKLSECLTPIYFEKNTPAKLTAWVGKHFEHNGVTADPSVCAYTVERCGREMYHLASETDKISFYVRSMGKNTVTREDVLYIAVPAAEYDAFALTNAISARRKEEALDILRDLKLRKADPIIIMSEIVKTVCDMTGVVTLSANGATSREISDILKVHEYRITLILRNNIRPETCRLMLKRCREADLELKTSRDGYAVIEKLICTI